MSGTCARQELAVRIIAGTAVQSDKILCELCEERVWLEQSEKGELPLHQNIVSEGDLAEPSRCQKRRLLGMTLHIESQIVYPKAPEE